jgi:hypothetical protein
MSLSREEARPRFGVTLGYVVRPYGPSSLERGRRPTDSCKVVTNPRISAGSTVENYWPRLFPVFMSNNEQIEVTMIDG